MRQYLQKHIRIFQICKEVEIEERCPQVPLHVNEKLLIEDKYISTVVNHEATKRNMSKVSPPNSISANVLQEYEKARVE